VDKPLAELGMPEKAYKLMEKWQDYRTLVEYYLGAICKLELVEIQTVSKKQAKSSGKPPLTPTPPSRSG